MSYRTMSEWNARGRQVMKGEKSMGRLNDNTPLFGKEQTKKTPPRTQKSFGYSAGYPSSYSGGGTNWDQGMDWDEMQEMGYDIGLPGQW